MYGAGVNTASGPETDHLPCRQAGPLLVLGLSFKQGAQGCGVTVAAWGTWLQEQAQKTAMLGERGSVGCALPH